MSKQPHYFNVYRLSLLAVMTALTAVGRLVFALPIMPNIQPMTALLVIIALNIGIIDSLVVALLSLLLTNMFLGMGPWTILQIISFAVIILLTSLIKRGYKTGSLMNRIVYSIWVGFTGVIYGFVISYLNFHLYGMSNFLVYYISGLPFDVLHAIGNVGFFLILEPVLVPIIEKRLKMY